MSKPTHFNVLSTAQAQVLRGLIGQVFMSISGDHLNSDLYADQILITTDQSVLCVSGKLSTFRFEGEPDTYSSIEVSARDEEIGGLEPVIPNLFKENPVSTIQDVFVVSDTVSMESKTFESFTYSAHTAIVLKFEFGYLAVCLLAFNAEILQVKSGAGQLDVFSRVPIGDFEDDHERKYSLSAKMYSLQ